MSRSFYRYLDTVGDGSGTKSATGDYSGALEEFKIVPADGVQLEVYRLIVSCQDTSTMQAQEYGNLGAALGNGIEVKILDASGTVQDLTDGVPITTNAEWASLCYDADVKSWGSGDELLTVRWTFARAGLPLAITGAAGEYLAVEVNDDLRGLISHYFMCQGIEK